MPVIQRGLSLDEGRDHGSSPLTPPINPCSSVGRAHGGKRRRGGGEEECETRIHMRTGRAWPPVWKLRKCAEVYLAYRLVEIYHRSLRCKPALSTMQASAYLKLTTTLQCRRYCDPRFATKETGSEKYIHWPGTTQLENDPSLFWTNEASTGQIQLTEFGKRVGEGREIQGIRKKRNTKSQTQNWLWTWKFTLNTK